MKSKKLLFITLLTTLVVLPVFPAVALTFGSDTYGSCQYSTCSISISSNGSLSLNVTPTSAGACTTQSDNVSVLTDDPSGYTLSLANSSTNTALINGPAIINSTSATQASPAALSADSWGYRVDGVGGFGSGPTSTQTNTSLNSVIFAQVPASNYTPDVLADTNVPADPAVNTTVWYSVCADTYEASGNYATQVTYSAITN